MLVQLISVKLQGREDKKEGEVGSFAHIAREMAIQSKGATKYMAIQVQTNKEASQRHTEVAVMPGLKLKRWSSLL